MVCVWVVEKEATPTLSSVKGAVLKAINEVAYFFQEKKRKRIQSVQITYLATAAVNVVRIWPLFLLKSTQYKKLVPNALRFTYQNLKSCKPHEKTKQKASKSIGKKLKTKGMMSFVSSFSGDLQDFKFWYVNRKAFGASFLYWVDFTCTLLTKS